MIWVLTHKTLYVVRCEDEVVDSMASINDIDMFVETFAGNQASNHRQDSSDTPPTSGLITVKYVPTEDEFNAKHKVAEYLGVKVQKSPRRKPENVEYPVYSAICTDLNRMNLFLSVFQVIKKKPGNFPW